MELNFVRGRGKNHLTKESKNETVNKNGCVWNTSRVVLSTTFVPLGRRKLFLHAKNLTTYGPINTAQEKSENAEKSRDYSDVIIFEKLRHSKCFLSTQKQRHCFQIPPLKIVFEKIRFRDSSARWPGRDIDSFYPHLFFYLRHFLSATSFFFLSATSFFHP